MRRIILDTDLSMGEPGSEIDDGFALALALAEPGLRLELVTTANGNTDVETATLLAVELAHRLGRPDLPVLRGAAAPLLRPETARSAPRDIVRRYGHRVPSPGYAATAIIETVLAAPGEVAIVAIAPLTNLATALAMEPRLASAVREIVIMGGMFLGQTGESAIPGEFNVWIDPEAAHAVLHSGAPIRWVGLDVTEQVRLTREHARQMSESASTFGAFAAEFTSAWIDRQAARNPGDPLQAQSCAMHDPLAVAAVVRPDLLGWRSAYVDVVTGDGIARGVMVTDLLTTENPPKPNCRIATSVDAEGFLSYFRAAIARV